MDEVRKPLPVLRRLHEAHFVLFFLIFFIFKLYIIVLVLPNIKMNPPQVFSLIEVYLTYMGMFNVYNLLI